MGRVIEPKQRGPIITIAKNKFFRGSSSIETKAFTQIQVTGPLRRHYASRGYDVRKVNSPLWVRTFDLPKASNLVIASKCLRCRKTSKRSLQAILQARACKYCYGETIGDALRSDKAKYESKYGVTINGYRSVGELCQVRKSCGCVVIQSMDVARMTGIQYCRHDSEKTWRSFEIFIRNALNANKGNKRRHGVAIDCVTNSLAVEVKLNLSAVQQNFGGRSPKDEIRRYRQWAKQSGRKFYVVVNETHETLRNSGLPGYYLGWEKWSEIGLTKKCIEIGKKFKFRPHEFRYQVLSKEERSDLLKYKRFAIALGRLPTASELKERMGLRYDYIARLALSNKGATIGEIGAALKLKLRPRNSTKSDRAEIINKFRNSCEEVGYLLPDAECEEECGTSLYNIMNWVVGRGQFSMKKLAKGLGVPNLRGKPMALNRRIEYAFDGAVISGRDLEEKIGLRKGYLKNLFLGLNGARLFRIPLGIRYQTGRKNIFPKKFRGKVIRVYRRPNAK